MLKVGVLKCLFKGNCMILYKIILQTNKLRCQIMMLIIFLTQHKKNRFYNFQAHYIVKVALYVDFQDF